MVNNNEHDVVIDEDEATTVVTEEDIDEIENAIRAYLADDDTDKIDERDEELEEYARGFKAIYENQFVEYLKNLPINASINVTSLPVKTYCKATFDQDSVNDSTTLVFYFDSVELEDDGRHIRHVHAYSFDRAQRCTFTPCLYRKYGPLYGTQLFCGVFNFERQRNAITATAATLKSEYYFLDLPVSLYRLVNN